MNEKTRVSDIDLLMERIRKELGRPQLSVDEIVRRAQLEISNRQIEQESESGSAGGSAVGYAHWRPATPRLPIKQAYALGELLAFSDADFIDVAYRTVLRRPPDAAGRQHNLELLRSGTTKVEILASLRWSSEGEARSVHVDGLLLPYLLQKWSRKPIVGPIVRWLRSFVRLGQIPERQMLMDAAQARETHELGSLVNRLADSVERRLLAIENAAEIQEHRLKESIAEFERIEALHEQRMAAATAATQGLDDLYAAFEDKFRGDMELVRTRVEPYLALVREAGAGTQVAPVIDLGSGRGEWLELLRENGLMGRGVDLNTVFLKACRDRGLDVTENDAIAELRSLPDGSVGAVTSMHLVEHLPFDAMVALIDHSLRVLRPGGLLVLETPNPENLQVASHWFYMDPTHRNPLPPEMLRWLVEARGFVDVRILRLTLARDVGVRALLPNEIAGAASLNELLASLSAPLDYAIVAKRP